MRLDSSGCVCAKLLVSGRLELESVRIGRDVMIQAVLELAPCKLLYHDII